MKILFFFIRLSDYHSAHDAGRRFMQTGKHCNIQEQENNMAKKKKDIKVYVIPTDRQIKARIKELFYKKEPYMDEATGKMFMSGGWNINNAPPYEEGMRWFRDFVFKKKSEVLPKLFLHQYDTTKGDEMRAIEIWELDQFFKGAEDMRNMIFKKPTKK